MRLQARVIPLLIGIMVAGGAGRVFGGQLDIFDQPLASGIANTVKPNLLFILDDSGSMDSDYLPDWVVDSICQGQMDNYGTGVSCNGITRDWYGNITASYDMLPFHSSTFNLTHYSPAVRYDPPNDVNSPYSSAGTEWDGTTRAAGVWPKANPSSAWTNPFGTSKGSINLTSSYPERYWCKSSSAALSECRAPGRDGTQYGYGYPNSLFSYAQDTVGKPYYYLMTGSPTWCTDASLSTCQTVRDSSHTYPRFSPPVSVVPGSAAQPAQPAVKATVVISISAPTASSTKSNGTKYQLSQIKCGSQTTATITPSTAYTTSTSSDVSTRRNDLSTWLLGQLSGCSGSFGYSLAQSTSDQAGAIDQITVSWPVAGTVGNNQRFYLGLKVSDASGFTVTVGGSTADSTTGTATYGTLNGGSDYVAAVPAVDDQVNYPTSGVRISKVVIDPSVTQYAKYADRSDCTTLAGYCSYAEELQNFANWYVYYRTRMTMMQTSVSRVFYGISDTSPGAGFRVGFDVISNTGAIRESIDNFVGSKKQAFFQKLFAATPSGYTPLRASLAKAGKIYAGNLSPDPVQYSCQQNFTFLSTDGYWNTNTESGSYRPYKEDGSTYVGNQDGTGSPATIPSATIAVSSVNSSSTVTAVSCGVDGNTGSAFTGTKTFSSSSSTTRRQDFASWLAGIIGDCPHPTSGAFTATASGTNVTVTWPSAGAVGNNQKFYLAVKVSSGAISTTPSNIIVSSIPSTLSGYLSFGGGVDTVASAVPPYADAYNVENSLADVAMYYYKTDLRSNLVNDVKPTSGDPATWQHMVTYTMGLGMSGLIGYDENYDKGGSSDFERIKNGTLNWPDPISNTSDARVDDLWHAAVNGRGKYFSAASPTDVKNQVAKAITTIAIETGAAAAAATSNMEPVAGDNYAYTGSYQTQVWAGDLQAYQIDPTTGAFQSTPDWSAAYQLSKQASKTRYTFDSSLSGTDKKRLLTWANLKTTGVDERTYFSVSQLSQCLVASACPDATAQNLFAYLMGGADASGVYRARGTVTNPADAQQSATNVLGDIVNSQPVYVTSPKRAFTDAGYAAFKSAYVSTPRPPTVYVGANDGFLHAFNAVTGDERWAYMPSKLMPYLYQLADAGYAHRYYVDAKVSENDAFDGTAWHTLLVGGLNKGGNLYYALDVTDPTAPKALWEFTDTSMGYSYGTPIITKLPVGTTSSSGADVGGKWVALVTSGYNNNGGNGQGVLYVLDAFTGNELFRMLTTSTVASSASPVGLAKIVGYGDNPQLDDTTLYVYGGDLNGDLWRFDLKAKTVFKVAALGEPITVRPEVGRINNKRVVFLGTGQFLQKTDAASTAQRTIYAIKDDAAETYTNIKTSGDFVEQVITSSGDSRSVTNNSVNWSTKAGWFINLPDSGERVNVDPLLVLGRLLVASNVPDVSGAVSCMAGGHGWLNWFDMNSGSYVPTSNVISMKVSGGLIVGVNYIRTGQGDKVIATVSDNTHLTKDTPRVTPSTGVRRVSWRELITE